MTDLLDFPSLDAFLLRYWRSHLISKRTSTYACGWWSKMCELQQRHLGLEHPTLASSLDNLALLYYNPRPVREGGAPLPAGAGDNGKSVGIRAPGHGEGSTIWPTFTTTRANTRRPSRCTNGRWRSEKRRGTEAPGHGRASTIWRTSTYQGKYTKAEPLYQRALAIREKALGPDHPEMATASTTWRRSTKTKANTPRLTLYQRALAIREKALGPEHPHVASSLNNLAVLYTTKVSTRGGAAL